MLLVTPAQMREMDRTTIEDIGVPGVILMEHAALGAVSVLLSHFNPEPGKDRIGLLCGGGNNGGDGFAMARLLTHRGFDVFVGLLTDPSKLKGDAAINYRVLEPLGIWCEHLTEPEQFGALPDCTIWCDALLGTGLDRPVHGLFADAIEFLNHQSQVLAIDIASGVHAQTGQRLSTAVQADATASFGLAKLGQVVSPGKAHTGALYVVDIGLTDETIRKVGVTARGLTPDWARDVLKARDDRMHKGDAGRVLLIGGSHEMSGAIMLSARAAIEAGAGLVTVGTTSDVVPRIALSCPEIMAFDANDHTKLDTHFSKVDCIGIGPGLGQDAHAETWLRLALTSPSTENKTLVLDADALNLIAKGPLIEVLVQAAQSRHIILTPHPGEMARLEDCSIKGVLAAPLEVSSTFARDSGCVVVLKGPGTIVVSELGELSINTTGNPGMASAGMGDVLTGMLAGLLPQYDDHVLATALAVCLHGMAGDKARDTYGTYGTTASRTLAHLGAVFRQLEGP